MLLNKVIPKVHIKKKKFGTLMYCMTLKVMTSAIKVD
jgi:hypothetical protein